MDRTPLGYVKNDGRGCYHHARWHNIKTPAGAWVPLFNKSELSYFRGKEQSGYILVEGAELKPPEPPKAPDAEAVARKEEPEIVSPTDEEIAVLYLHNYDAQKEPTEARVRLTSGRVLPLTSLVKFMVDDGRAQMKRGNHITFIRGENKNTIHGWSNLVKAIVADPGLLALEE